MSRSRAARRPVCCPSRRPGFASPLHVACAAAQASRHCRVLPELPPRPRVTAVCCARAAAWASRHRRMLPPQPAARVTLQPLGGRPHPELTRPASPATAPRLPATGVPCPGVNRLPTPPVSQSATLAQKKGSPARPWPTINQARAMKRHLFKLCTLASLPLLPVPNFGEPAACTACARRVRGVCAARVPLAGG